MAFRSRIERPQWVVLCRSSLRRVLVKSNANGWSARMRLTGQWQCKWVAKSMQLRIMSQMSFSVFEYAGKRKQICLKRFLAEMDQERLAEADRTVLPEG